MGYQMCEAVRSAILATDWLLIFDVPLCSDVKSSRPKWPRRASASASKRLFIIGGSLEPSLYLGPYIGFWRYSALGILQYPSRKKDIIFSLSEGGPT